MLSEVEKIQQILINENYIKQILATNTDTEIKKIFENNGVILNEKQFEAVKKVFGNAILTQLKKLNPEELENISGGKVNTTTLEEYAQIGGASGVLIGGAIGGTIGGIYSLIHTISKAGESNNDFIKNIIKIFSETGVAMAIGAFSGATVGGISGAAVAVIDQPLTETK